MNLCVGPEATGTGSGVDWDNIAAWNPSAFVRGNVYFAKSGDYRGLGAPTLNTATSGTTVITIRKATVNSHGTAIGWDNSLATGQAEFQAPLKFRSSYWVWDGQERTGLRSGYGFLIDNNTAPVNDDVISYGDTSPTVITHVDTLYTEAFGSGDQTDTYNDSGILVSAVGGCSDFYWSNMWVHDLGAVGVAWRETSNCILEASVVERNSSTADQHSEGIVLSGGNTSSNNLIIRDCVLSDIEGTAYIATPSGVLGHELSNIQIYNNTFVTPQVPQRGGVGDGVFTLFGCNVTGSCLFANNLIINFRDAVFSGYPPPYNFTNPNVTVGNGFETNMERLDILNNIWVSCDAINDPDADPDAHITTFNRDYNGYYATVSTLDASAHKVALPDMPLVDWPNGDYHLVTGSEAIATGTDLSAYFTTDADGLTRTIPWDIGAYAYEGAAGSLNVTTLNVTTMVLG